MELYRTSGGSKFFGIDIPGSDTDTLICDNHVLTKQSIYNEENKKHIYRLSVPEAIVQLNAFVPIPQWLAFLYPEGNSIEPINAYLYSNAENIISANKKMLFTVLNRYLGETPTQNLLELSPKKQAYRLMFLEGFAKYADTGNFLGSVVQTGENQEFFRKIRESKISYAEYIEHWEQAQLALLKNCHFFDEFDLNFLKENTKKLEQIFGYSHKEFVQGALPLLQKIPEVSVLF